MKFAMRAPRLIILLTLAVSWGCAAVQAAPKKPLPKAAKPRPEATESAPSAAAPHEADKLIYDAWYTITVDPGATRAGYYNDRVELRKGRVFFQNHVWKKEEDYINEEQLGAYAENTPELAPLFFNYHSTYRTTETSIDGTVSGGRSLSIKARKGSNELPVVKKMLPKGTFFEVFFPLWLSARAKELQPGQSKSFNAVFENTIEDGFRTVSGRVKMEKPDESMPGVSRFKVDLSGMKSVWWVDAQGIPARIEFPSLSTVVERSTREKAQKFLEEGR